MNWTNLFFGLGLLAFAALFSWYLINAWLRARDTGYSAGYIGSYGRRVKGWIAVIMLITTGIFLIIDGLRGA
nr:hypothetical protein [uncultured Mucilaginibacter sp.]